MQNYQNYFFLSDTPIIIKFSGSKHLPNNSKCSAYGIQISKLPVGGGKLISEHFLKVLLNREGSLKVLTHDLVFATKQRLQSTFQWKEIDLGRQTCHNQGQSTLVCWCVGWNTVVLSAVHSCDSSLKSVNWCIGPDADCISQDTDSVSSINVVHW